MGLKILLYVLCCILYALLRVLCCTLYIWQLIFYHNWLLYKIGQHVLITLDIIIIKDASMMSFSSALAFSLFLPLGLIHVQADVLLVASLIQHEGSVAIAGDDETCRSRGEAALRCERTSDCQGISYYENGTEKHCQVATCPSSPGKLNLASVQAGFFFVFIGTFQTGNSMTKQACHGNMHGKLLA